MQTRRKSIENFIKCMDEFISANYVLSDAKLSNVMRALSSSKLFYTLLEFCTQDFDYQSAFSSAFIKGDGFGKGSFVLPSNSKSVIALGFSVLYQLNVKELDFYKLLDEYFYLRNYNDSFKNFSMQFLVPFRCEVLKAAEIMLKDGEVVAGAPADLSTDADKLENKSFLNEDEVERISALLDQSKATILQYKIEAKLKAELVVLYDAFQSALKEGDDYKIKIAFLGYKYATYYHRKADNSVWKIEKILISKGVI